MKSEVILLSNLELFKTFFKINIITFGGGFTIAPVIIDEFSTKRKLVEKQDMLDLIALAQSGPGALAVSTCLLVGYKVNGLKGAFVSILASILPPLLVISVLYYFYAEVATNYWVRAALRGMSGVICAVLILTTYQLGKVALMQRPVFSGLIILGTFLVGYFTNINIAIIIISLALLGAVLFSIKGIKVP